MRSRGNPSCYLLTQVSTDNGSEPVCGECCNPTHIVLLLCKQFPVASLLLAAVRRLIDRLWCVSCWAPESQRSPGQSDWRIRKIQSMPDHGKCLPDVTFTIRLGWDGQSWRPYFLSCDAKFGSVHAAQFCQAVLDTFIQNHLEQVCLSRVTGLIPLPRNRYSGFISSHNARL